MTERPVDGDRSPIDSEIERLRSLRDELTRAAERLRDIRVTMWTGGAAEAFDGFVATLCSDLYRTADQHEDTADQLAEYRDVSLRASAVAHDINEQWAGSQVPSDVADRLAALRRQEREAGVRASDGVRRASAMLYNARRRLRELPPGTRMPTFTATPVAPPAPPERPNGHGNEQPTDPAPSTPAAPSTPNVNFAPAMKIALVAELRQARHFKLVEES